MGNDRYLAHTGRECKPVGKIIFKLFQIAYTYLTAHASTSRIKPDGVVERLAQPIAGWIAGHALVRLTKISASISSAASAA